MQGEHILRNEQSFGWTSETMNGGFAVEAGTGDSLKALIGLGSCNSLRRCVHPVLVVPKNCVTDSKAIDTLLPTDVLPFKPNIR